jgi:hypothetical protein
MTRAAIRLAVGAVLVGVLAGCQPQPVAPVSAPVSAPAQKEMPRVAGAPRLLGESGNVPDNVSVSDTKLPAVVRLDPALLFALRRAATDAKADGVRFVVNSGWRSAEYQARLLREAVKEYGSEAEAARWVATPQTSPHVSGDAVDLGPANATTWLAEHGPRYGLCRIYVNEPWHFELRPDAPERGCPPRYADPTEDPRMR